MRRVSLPNDRDGTLMEQSWIMNMNWTEIKAAWGDCDSGNVFSRQVETFACRASLKGQRDPWVQWYPSWRCHFHNHLDSRTHQSQWQASRTHTPTIMTKDATCIQMRVEVRARQILQGAARPRGEIQPQSPLYHYSKIGWRWRHGKYSSVSELMGTAQGESRPDDVCMWACVHCWQVCVYVCEINSCIWFSPFFSCLHKRECACVCDARTGASQWSCAIQCSSPEPSLSLFLCWDTINGSSCKSAIAVSSCCFASPFEPFLGTVLGQHSGQKWPSSTSNFTTRHRTQTIPLRSAWLDPFALDTSSAYWLMGLISESGGALRHQSLSRPYLFFRACDSLLRLIKESKFRQREQKRKRAAERDESKKKKKACVRSKLLNFKWNSLTGLSKSRSVVA